LWQLEACFGMVTQREKGTATLIIFGISTLAEKAITAEENHFPPETLLAAKHDHSYPILYSYNIYIYIYLFICLFS
jgi:hypothetical protein